jgi:SAM-dependent methyltransferase
LQRYLFAERFVIGKRVLDLACGVGHGSYVLRTLGANTVVGVDLDPNAIDYATKHYKREGLSFEQGNALLWQSDSQFDVVISFETIEHLPSSEVFLNQVASHLAPGGTLIISAPNTLQYLKANPPNLNEHHINEPDYKTFREWLDGNFVIDGEWEQSPVTLDISCLHLNSSALSTLVRQYWVRLANKVERALRGFSGRKLPTISTYDDNNQA